VLGHATSRIWLAKPRRGQSRKGAAAAQRDRGGSWVKGRHIARGERGGWEGAQVREIERGGGARKDCMAEGCHAAQEERWGWELVCEEAHMT